MIDRIQLINKDSRAKALLESLDAMPQDGGDMTPDEIVKLVELVKIYERLYLDSFVKEHDDFPAKAAMAFMDQYTIEKLPAVMDIESLTIPTTLKEFQLLEFQTAILLKGCGCSERLIAEFLGRNRETVHKYVAPVTKALEDSQQLDKEERDAVVLPVIKNIIGQLSGNVGAL